MKGKIYMIKKLMAVLLCAVMIMTFGVVGFAEEEASAKTYVLSLEDSIKMALENDQTYKNFDSALLDAQKQIDNAKIDQREIKGSIPLPSGISMVAVKQGYYVEQAKIGLETTKRSKQQYEKRTAYLITQSYFGVKVAEESVKTAQIAYDLAADNKKNVDLQFSLGMVSKLDVKNAQYTLNEAKAQLDKYIRSLHLTYKSFASSLFIEESDAKFVLTDEITYEEFAPDLKSDTEKAVDIRLDLYQLKSVAMQAERYTNVTKLLGQTSAEHSASMQSKLTAESNYKNAVRQVDIQINSVYNSILDSRDALKLAEENYAIRKQEYEVAVIQYDLGIITNSQLITIMNIMTGSKIQLDNAKLTYKLAVEKYKCETNVGLGM